MPTKFRPRRDIGRTGFKASAIGIGDLADKAVPIEQCVATVRRAMDAGLNVIDTAPSYEEGYSERIVGAALAGNRDGVFLIDKIDHVDQAARPQVDGSLKRLGLEMIDLVVFHGVSKMEDWEVVRHKRLAELDKCVAAGKLRFKGISSHDPDVLLAAIKSRSCDVLMFPLGPYCDERYVEQVLPQARQAGIGAVCFKTFGAGKLLGDTAGYGRPLEDRPRGNLSPGGTTPATPMLPHLSVYECISYTLTLDPDVALLGLSFPNEQDIAFAAVHEFSPLTPQRMADVRRRAKKAIRAKGPIWWDPQPTPAVASNA